jgi:hypothetical protein
MCFYLFDFEMIPIQSFNFKISIDHLKIASSLYTPFTKVQLSLRLFFQTNLVKSAVLAAFSVPIFAYNW